MIQSHLKKIFSDTLIYGIGNILNRFLNFLLLPFYTHYFSPSEYGIFSLIYAFWFFAAVFYLFGMETAFQKFFIESKEIPEKQHIFSSTMVLMLIISSTLSFIMYLSSGLISVLLTGSNANGYLIKLLSALLILDTLSRFPMILINARQLSKIYIFINTSGVAVNIVFNVVFIAVLGYGIEAIFYSYIISYVYILLVSLFVCREYIKFTDDSISPGKLKPVVSFAHLFLYYGIFIISLDLIDRFFLGYFKGSSEVGIYSACYRIGLVMNLMISGFRTAWFPFFLNLKDDVDNKIIFSKIFSLFCYGGMLMFLLMSLFADDIIKIKIGSFWLLDERYWSGITILPFILLSYFLFGLYTNLNVAAYYTDKIKYLIISSAAGCISNIIFNIILIPRSSYFGAAISTFFSYLLIFIILYVNSQKLFHIKYEWNKVISVIVITLSLFVLNSYYFNTVLTNSLIIYIIKVLSVISLVLVLYKYGSLKPLKSVN